jgi:hypothetical protein
LISEQWTALLALRHIPDLTEIDCVQAMKFYLAKPAKELEEILMERSTGTLGGNLRMFSADSMDLQETGTDVFMRCILAGIPFDEVFMTRALKRLSSTELTALLEFAQRWVRRFREYGAMEVERMFQQQQQQQATLLSDNVDAVAWSKIDLPMICQFLSCIIDAHTANLIISPSFHQTLADLKSFIGQETELCNNIETLRGVLLDVYGVKAAADLTAKSAKKKGKATKKTAAGLITAPTALYSIQKVQWW